MRQGAMPCGHHQWEANFGPRRLVVFRLQVSDENGCLGTCRLQSAFDYFGGWRFASTGTHSCAATSGWCMLPAASSFHMFHNQNSFRIIQKSQFQNLHDSFQLGLEIHWTHSQKEIKIPKTKSDKDRKHSNSLTFTDGEVLFLSLANVQYLQRPGVDLWVSALKVRHQGHRHQQLVPCLF